MMEIRSKDPYPAASISVQRLMLINECPLEWRFYDLYLFRDSEVVFYVGQSRLAFVRVWEHIIQGYKGRSIVGRFILANWPASMKFNIELISSRSSQFTSVCNDVNTAEQYLIAALTPCFNEVLNSQPSPVPGRYRPYNAPLRCSRSPKHLIREAGYAASAEDKKTWLGE
jgi:hypothetical protein